METHPSLADQFAGLRAIPTTPNADTTLLSAALRALIAAIFARIFGRLEQILLLWQSGTLPAPSIRAPRAATPPRQRPAKPRRHRASQRTRAHLPKPQVAKRHRTPISPAASAPFAATLPPVRPRPARDPPSCPRLKRFLNPAFRGRLAML